MSINFIGILVLLVVGYFIVVEIYEDQTAWYEYMKQKEEAEEEQKRYEIDQIMRSQLR